MNDLDGKIEWRGEGKDRPVDTKGALPRGEKFASFAECKEQLVKHYGDDVVRGLLKFLVLYATGNKPDINGLAEVRKIMAEQKGSGYLLRDMLKSVVKSSAFLDN